MSVRRAAKLGFRAALALALTIASAFLAQRDDLEVGIYGNMGTLHENVRPRIVGGWPAPFMADRQGSSVPFDLGAEDNFRPGPFVADLAFWFLVTTALARLATRVSRRGSRN